MKARQEAEEAAKASERMNSWYISELSSKQAICHPVILREIHYILSDRHWGHDIRRMIFISCIVGRCGCFYEIGFLSGTYYLCRGPVHGILWNRAGLHVSSTIPPTTAMNRKQKKKRNKKKNSTREDVPNAAHKTLATVGIQKQKQKKTGLSTLSALKQKLQGSKFRWLNEVMYTRSGKESLDMIQKTPQLYHEYHQGYREQTKQWPERPVDRAVAWLSKKPKEWFVIDLGCGDAELSKRAPQSRMENFDLAPAPNVTVCNIASLPLQSSSVDVAVFCLSLMGVDYGSFIEEAARVLKVKGWLWIAEVQSRCMDDKGNSMLDSLISAIESIGFTLKSKSVENSHFFNIVFQKKKERAHGKPSVQVLFPPLRACLYKKR